MAVRGGRLEPLIVELLAVVAVLWGLCGRTLEESFHVAR